MSLDREENMRKDAAATEFEHCLEHAKIETVEPLVVDAVQFSPHLRHLFPIDIVWLERRDRRDPHRAESIPLDTREERVLLQRALGPLGRTKSVQRGGNAERTYEPSGRVVDFTICASPRGVRTRNVTWYLGIP